MDDRTKQIIEELRAENRRLCERIKQLESENRRLREQLEQAQMAAARQAAPFRREEQKKIPPDKHKPSGRKPGHPGCCRKEPDHIDETIEMPSVADILWPVGCESAVRSTSVGIGGFTAS